MKPAKGEREKNGNRTFRKSLRNENINYRNGWFFVTCQVARNKSIFGAIVGEQCELNDFGRQVEAYWRELPAKYPELELDEFVLMPNHFHAIVRIRYRPTNREQHLGFLMSRFKGGTGYIYGKLRRAGAVEDIGEHLWQFDYWDKIVTSEEQLDAFRRYIRENPKNWSRDRFGAVTQYSFGNLELLRGPRIAFVASQGFWASELRPRLIWREGGLKPAAPILAQGRSEPAAPILAQGRNEPAAAILAQGRNEPAAAILAQGRSEPGAAILAQGRNEPAAAILAHGRNVPGAAILAQGRGESGAAILAGERAEARRSDIARRSDVGEGSGGTISVRGASAPNPAIISTFTSAQEREALRRALAKGRRIIQVIPQGIPRENDLPPELLAACREGRALLLSPQPPDSRLNKKVATWCNEYVLRHASEIWAGDISPNGMLASMLKALGRGT